MLSLQGVMTHFSLGAIQKLVLTELWDSSITVRHTTHTHTRSKHKTHKTLTSHFKNNNNYISKATERSSLCPCAAPGLGCVGSCSSLCQFSTTASSARRTEQHVCEHSRLHCSFWTQCIWWNETCWIRQVFCFIFFLQKKIRRDFFVVLLPVR